MADGYNGYDVMIEALQKHPELVNGDISGIVTNPAFGVIQDIAMGSGAYDVDEHQIATHETTGKKLDLRRSTYEAALSTDMEKGFDTLPLVITKSGKHPENVFVEFNKDSFTEAEAKHFAEQMRDSAFGHADVRMATAADMGSGQLPENKWMVVVPANIMEMMKLNNEILISADLCRRLPELAELADTNIALSPKQIDMLNRTLHLNGYEASTHNIGDFQIVQLTPAGDKLLAGSLVLDNSKTRYQEYEPQQKGDGLVATLDQDSLAQARAAGALALNPQQIHGASTPAIKTPGEQVGLG